MNKEVQLLQLAIKAGKTVSGDRLIPAIQSQTVCLVLMNRTCGNNRKKKLRNKCAFYQIPLIEWDASLFDQISWKVINAYGITDDSFTQAFMKERTGDVDGI